MKKTRSNPAHRNTEKPGLGMHPLPWSPPSLYNSYTQMHAPHVALFLWQQRVNIHLWLLVWIMKNELLWRLKTLAPTAGFRGCQHRYLDAYGALRKRKGHRSFCAICWQNNLPLPSKNTRLALSRVRLPSLISWDFGMQDMDVKARVVFICVSKLMQLQLESVLIKSKKTAINMHSFLHRATWFANSRNGEVWSGASVNVGDDSHAHYI